MAIIWQNKHYDPQSTSRCPYSLNGDTIGVKALNGVLSDSFVINSNNDETMFLGTSTKTYAIDKNMDTTWSVSVPSTYLTLSDDGTILYSVYGDTITALDTSNGVANWIYTVPSTASAPWGNNGISIETPVIIGQNIGATTQNYLFIGTSEGWAKGPGAQRYFFLNWYKINSNGDFNNKVNVFAVEDLTGSPISRPLMSKNAAINPDKTIIYFGFYGYKEHSSYARSVSTTDLTLSTSIEYFPTGRIDPVGLTYLSPSQVYISIQYSSLLGGLFKVDFSSESVKWNHNTSNQVKVSPCAISENETIYYRDGKFLFSITDDGNSYTENWSYPYLSSLSNIGPIVGGSSLIYIPSLVTNGAP